jgi:hypothetical protein
MRSESIPDRSIQLKVDPINGMFSDRGRERIIPPSRLELCALIGGVQQTFKSIEDKFSALADAWNDYSAGSSVRNYNHLSHLQIIGMGLAVVPFLLRRVAAGEGAWIYALKCITGHEAESPNMQGDAQRVIAAWVKWGERHGKL